jgi:hypothetical protein
MSETLSKESVQREHRAGLAPGVSQDCITTPWAVRTFDVDRHPRRDEERRARRVSKSHA